MEQILKGIVEEKVEGVQLVKRAMCAASTFLPPEERSSIKVLEHVLKYIDLPEIRSAYNVALEDYIHKEKLIEDYVKEWKVA